MRAPGQKQSCSICGAIGFTARSHPAHPDVPVRLGPKRARPKRSRPRAQTISRKAMTREELRIGALLYPVVDIDRPRTRGECHDAVRPCPWVACKFHLYLDINVETGSIKINFPELEVWELPNTCALDVAERGGITLEEVGQITNLTRERIRQLEVRGLLKLKFSSTGGDAEIGARIADLGAFEDAS